MIATTLDSVGQPGQSSVMTDKVVPIPDDYATSEFDRPQTPFPVTLDIGNAKQDEIKRTPSPKTPSKSTGLRTPPPTSTSSAKQTIAHVHATPVSPQRISEITDSLKTRLSYAFMKFNKGWTEYSLEHLESLQSRQDAQKVIAELANTTRMNQNFNFPTRIIKQNTSNRPRVTQKGTFSQTSGTFHDYSNSDARKESALATHRRTSSDSALSASTKSFKRNLSRGSQSPSMRERIRRVSFSSNNDAGLDCEPSSLSISTRTNTLPETDAAKSLMFLSSPHSAAGRGI